jgi:DNA-directed RNA polymerase specialized sigma24 family protein
MGSGDSISQWIVEVKAGDPAAAQKLWERYVRRLAGLARQKLRALRRGMADEEDVVLSAFDSFCRGAKDGRFPQLNDRNNLWRLLVVLTARKAIDLVNWEMRQRRGGGKVRGESALVGPPDSSPDERGIEQVIGREPTPEFATEVAENCQRLLDSLGDGELRSVALWKMEGYTNVEIAAKLGCVVPTVERKLRVIRSLWSRELDS